MYEECHQENRQLSYDIHGVKLQLEKVKHQLELAAQVSPYNTIRVSTGVLNFRASLYRDKFFGPFGTLIFKKNASENARIKCG